MYKDTYPHRNQADRVHNIAVDKGRLFHVLVLPKEKKEERRG